MVEQSFSSPMKLFQRTAESSEFWRAAPRGLKNKSIIILQQGQTPEPSHEDYTRTLRVISSLIEYFRLSYLDKTSY